jgi:aerobic carbon-monoxide dehydrogenase large subunit
MSVKLTPSKHLHQAQTPALLRREDARLLTGQGAFVGRGVPADALHAVFVRSPYAHAAVRAVDADHTRSLGGVVAVLTASAFAGLPQPQVNEGLCPLLPETFAQMQAQPLMGDTVRYVGAPVALVVARSREAAQAGADAVVVAYEALEAVLDGAQDALCVATLRHTLGEMPNRFDQTATPPALLAKAAPTAAVRVALPRVAASPLENRAALMSWDAAAQTLTAQLSTQTPARAQHELAAALNLPLAHVRVTAVDVGGAFGGKASLFPEDLMLACAAKQLHATLLWQATRGEDLLCAVHGRGAQLAAQLWVDASGAMQALQADVQFALGAWLPYSAVVPMRNAVRILPGPYRVANVAVNGTASASHTAAVGIYRGAGRPEAAILMERAVDAAAATLGIDPLTMRLANVWQPQELPRSLSVNAYQDTADFPALLRRCAALFDYAGKCKALQHKQQQPHQHGPWRGIGMALYTEPCGAGGESVRLTANADGTYLLATGATAQGQGRETAYAQIAAQALGCAASCITVSHGDTAHNPAGVGALASRSTAIGGSAILAAVAQLQTELQAALQAASQATSKAKAPTDFQTTAQATIATEQTLPHTVEVFHTVAQEAWGSGCVMVALSVEPDTGQPTIDELVWVDDAGQVVNDALVHGQLIGGMAQGIGQALMERIVYDEYGQLLTGSLMDYALPRATDMPATVIIDSLPSRSAANALGAKGVGEAGCIGVPAAILNAAYHALRRVPKLQLDFPLTAQQLWRAMNG